MKMEMQFRFLFIELVMYVVTYKTCNCLLSKCSGVLLIFLISFLII
jgi:hypothetical protein